MAETGTFTDRLVGELLQWENDLRPLREEWDRMLRAWMITPPEPVLADTLEGKTQRKGEGAPNPFLAQFTVPYRFHAVETILPRILGDDPKITYTARDHDSDEPVAAIMSCLVQEQLEDMDFDLEIRDFIRQALIKNYSVAKVYWNQEVRQTTTKQTHTHQDPEYVGVSYQVEQEVAGYEYTVNEPGFEVIDTRDFVWPLAAKNIQSASAVWQRRWVTLGYLKRMQDAGHYGPSANGDSVKKVGDLDGSTEWKNSRRNELAYQNLSVGAYEYADPDDRIVELWERWANNRLIVIADPRGSKVTLRDEPNPFHHGRKPFIDYTPIPILGRLTGMGVIRTIYDLAEDLDTKRRQAADAMTFTLNPMWWAPAGVDPAQLVARPGGIVRDVNDSGEKPEPLINPQVDWAAFGQYESRVYDDLQRTSGASTYLDGSGGQGASATEVATISQEANKRLAEMIKVFDRRSMRELARQMWRNNEQFLDEGVAVDLSKDEAAAQAFAAYITQQQGMAGEAPNGVARITPELLKSDGRLRPVPLVGQDLELSKQQKQSTATQLAATVTPAMPILAQVGWDVKAFVSYLMDEFGVPKDVRDAVNAGQPMLPPQSQSGPGGDNRPTGQPPGGGPLSLPGPAGSYAMANGNG